jgi:hypothetical protein
MADGPAIRVGGAPPLNGAHNKMDFSAALVVLIRASAGGNRAKLGYDFTLLGRALPVGVVYQMPVVVA